MAKICEFNDADDCTTDWSVEVAQWCIDVYNRRDAVDASNELDWFSLAYGWALGKGMDPESSYEFAIHVRYHTEFG